MRQPVDRYVDRLLRRRRPKPFAPTEDELSVLRAGIDLSAAAPDAGEPRTAFVEALRERLAERARTDQDAAEPPRPAWRAPARRRILAAGALTAAGAAAGASVDRMLGGGNAGSAAASSQTPPQTEITPTHGTWQTVLDSADLPEGAVLQFDLGAVNGFLRRVSGRVQAVSGICTHQGCRLALDATHELLTCPCHGATFTPAGLNLTHPRPMSRPLPALPRLPVREQDGRIQIYAPSTTA
jgi:nitrite reductase/ring-hydroxylating ferredoxin subunit